MKRSMCGGCFPGMNFDQLFAKAKELGLECIELGLDEQGANSITPESDESTYAKIREAAQKYGIETSSITTSLYNVWKASFGSPKGSKKYEDALKILRKQIEAAKGIGADTILVVTNIDADTGYVNSIENTIATFRELEEEIKASGITIALENITNQFFMSPYDVKYVIEKIDNPLVRFYFDAGNVLEFSPIEFWIDAVGKYIQRVHIKDFLPKPSKYTIYNIGGTWPDLLEGSLDFEMLITKLQEIGYDGPITAEVGNSKPERSWDDFLKDNCVALDKIVKMAN